MDIKSDRISVVYFSDNSEDVEHYSWMFMEDLRQNLASGIGAKGEVIEFSMAPYDESFKKLIMESLPYDRSYRRCDFSEFILRTVQFVGEHLVHRGYLVLEMVHISDTEDVYKLVPVYGSEVRVDNSEVIQVIDQANCDRLNISASEIRIPIEKCFIIEFPEKLGGKTGYLKFLDELKLLGKQTPAFYGSVLSKVNGYDFTEHCRLYELELWRMTKPYYWHHRQYGSKLFSGYYHFYRRLQFRKTKLILRDYIIEQIGIIIKKMSNMYFFDIELHVEGKFESEEIAKALKDWENGTFDVQTIDHLF